MNDSSAYLPRVLLTGARGKVASKVIPELRRHCRLHRTDITPAHAEENDYTQADLRDFSNLEEVVAGYDAIVHMAIAAEPREREKVGKGEIDPFEEMILRVNVEGTTHLFEAARRQNVKKIVFISSMTVLWGNRHRSHYDHLTDLEPKNLYACSKIFGENLAKMYHRRHGMSAICLRIGQPYPIHPEADFAWQTNRRSRSIYVSMEDITRSVLCALQTSQPFGIYNIVSASDNQRVDLSHAKEIGYVPQSYFRAECLEHYADGAFPQQVEPVVCY